MEDHPDHARPSEQPDVWEAAFEHAGGDATAGDRRLVPYWLYPLDDGAWVERHVPLYPLSRHAIRYEAVKKTLGAYRLVFGQPRQDELLAYLRDRVDLETLRQLEKSLRIDLSPPASNLPGADSSHRVTEAHGGPSGTRGACMSQGIQS